MKVSNEIQNDQMLDHIETDHDDPIIHGHGIDDPPIRSAICFYLVRRFDLRVLEYWQDGFGQYANDVLATVQRLGRCTEKQADVLASECANVSRRRYIALLKLARDDAGGWAEHNDERNQEGAITL